MAFSVSEAMETKQINYPKCTERSKGMSSNTPPAALSVDSVIKRAWTMFMKSPGIYLGIGAIFGLVNILITVLLSLASSAAGSLLSNITSMVISLLGGAAVVYVSFQDLRGVRVGIKEALTYVFGCFLPLFLVALLSGIGISIGLLLFIVPGLFLICVWIVALPACIAEKLGAVDCLRRSWELTKGYRLTILGIMGVIIVAVILAGAIVTFLAYALIAITDSFVLAVILAGLPSLALALVMSAVLSLISVVLYADLRGAKEGISKESLAELLS